MQLHLDSINNLILIIQYQNSQFHVSQTNKTEFRKEMGEQTNKVINGYQNKIPLNLGIKPRVNMP